METNAKTRAQRELESAEREHAMLADAREEKRKVQTVLMMRGYSIAEAIYATRDMAPRAELAP